MQRGGYVRPLLPTPDLTALRLMSALGHSRHFERRRVLTASPPVSGHFQR
jgi:hypothetical protein